jgi:hypothetical protein
MTLIQWTVVELPYLSQDFVIVLALVYMIVGMLFSSGFILGLIVTNAHRLNPKAPTTDTMHGFTVLALIYPYVIWCWVFDD